MNGCIIKDTPIAVDFWQIRQQSHLKIFFLSHMHGDHTKGLSGSWRRPIYCSPVTARLLPAKLNVPASLVRPLEIGESHIIPLDETGQETMTVSLIDANHCPGAVMFLFEGYFGRILYTGDFRYHPSMITDTILSSCGQVDRLYLDNTYNNPKCVWPGRLECSAKIIDIISNYPGYEVVIGVHKLGKEDLLVDIALALKLRIVVNPDRMKTMKILELPDVFTTDSSQSRVRAVPQHLVTRKNLSKWQEGAPTIAILPTALYTSLDMEPYADHPDFHVVPYSDHSSYSELIEFVSHIKPKSITPVVGGSRFEMGNADMSVFDPFLTSSTEFDKRDMVIPESVLKYMRSASTCQLLKNVDRGKTKQKKPVTVRKNSSKDLPRGVVFSDDVDEDLAVEMERRRESKQQRHTGVSLSQDEQSCKDTFLQTLNMSPNKDTDRDVGSSGDDKRHEFCKQSPKWSVNIGNDVKPEDAGVNYESIGSKVLKPCQSFLSNAGARNKAPKRPKMDVYSMLLASASRRKSPAKGSDDKDVIIRSSEERTASKQDAVNVGDSNLSQETFSEVPSLLNEDQVKNPTTVPTCTEQIVDSPKALTENSNGIIDSKVPCTDSDPINSVQTCSKVTISNMNKGDYTSRSPINSSISKSGFLKLPCSIRPINKKRKRIDPVNIFKNFLQK